MTALSLPRLRRSLLPDLKARLIARNERDQRHADALAATRGARDAERAAAALTEAVALARAEGAQEAAGRIAGAILAASPPPRGHVCEQPEWCIWCLPSAVAQRCAAIARGSTERNES